MAKKIFVGSLAWETTDDDLQTLFAEYGTVISAKVIMDRMSGRSRGFGFVEMEDDSAADDAISKLDGSEFQGRSLTVNEAKPMENRSGGRPGGNGGRGGFDRRNSRDQY